MASWHGNSDSLFVHTPSSLVETGEMGDSVGVVGKDTDSGGGGASVRPCGRGDGREVGFLASIVIIDRRWSKLSRFPGEFPPLRKPENGELHHIITLDIPRIFHETTCHAYMQL